MQSYDNPKKFILLYSCKFKLMQTVRFIILLTLSFLVLSSCKKEIELNAEWKEITIIYGVLNQLDSAHYIKVTKAFLGPGNAMQYAREQDSSNFSNRMDVTLEAWDGATLVAIYRFDTTTIYNKDSGLFYYPNQLVYSNDSILNASYTYKLNVRNPENGNVCRSETKLVHDFDIGKPLYLQKINFKSGVRNPIEWISAEGGKRYQIIIRFHYLESELNNLNQVEAKYIDWVVFSNEQSKTDEGGEEINKSYDGGGFYQFLNASLTIDPNLSRVARGVDYLFVVAGNDLNTYIEVTQPSNSIIQEKPSFSNIENGIGLFSARFLKLDSHQLTTETIQELKVNPLTKDLGF